MLRVAVHVHSTVSTGEWEPEAIVAEAERAGLDAVVFTDSLVRRWEYGVWPARGLIKRVVEQPSVTRFGADRYLSRLAALGRQQPDVLVLGGVEAAPSYYWSRSPFDRAGGQIKNWQQHLLVVGVDDPRALASLPIDADPYHGDRGALPYQRVLDAVRRAGGLAFWAHPESAHAARHGGIEDYTEPYTHLLEMTDGYHGFALTYAGYTTSVEPGGRWDRVLEAYRRGERAEPVFVIGELDWRGPARAIDSVTTTVRAEARTPRAVLSALRRGDAWASIHTSPHPMTRLRAFTVDAAPAGGARIRLAASRDAAVGGPTRVRIVRNGELFVDELVDDAEIERAWHDAPSGPRTYYRVLIEDGSGFIYGNPVFMSRDA